MRLFDIVVFLALMGAVAGLFQGVQSTYSTDWWGGYHAQNLTTVVITDSDIDNINNDNSGIASTIEDVYNAVYFALGLLWNMIKGIFYIKGVVLDNIIVYNDVDGNNILEPINWIIQIGIYVMAAFGWYQLKSKQSYGSGY